VFDFTGLGIILIIGSILDLAGYDRVVTEAMLELYFT